MIALLCTAALVMFWIETLFSSTERAKARLWRHQYIDYGYEIPVRSSRILVSLIPGTVFSHLMHAPVHKRNKKTALRNKQQDYPAHLLEACAARGTAHICRLIANLHWSLLQSRQFYDAEFAGLRRITSLRCCWA